MYSKSIGVMFILLKALRRYHWTFDECVAILLTFFPSYRLFLHFADESNRADLKLQQQKNS